jgi:hypothetical protein
VLKFKAIAASQPLTDWDRCLLLDFAALKPPAFEKTFNRFTDVTVEL